MLRKQIERFIGMSVIMALVMFMITPIAGAQEGAYYPADEWRISTAEEQGMTSQKLVDMLDWLEEQEQDFHSILVIRNGHVVLDVSTDPFASHEANWITWATPSIVSTLAGIAIDQGYIESVDQSLWEFFPAETTPNMDAEKEAITLEHLLTMTLGMRVSNYGRDMWALTEEDQSWVEYALKQPMLHPPGERFAWTFTAPHLISAAIQQATGITTADFARQNLFEPLGITDVTWVTDPQGISEGSGGMALSAHDLAKLGYLVLNGGEWDGQQIVSPEWLETVLMPRFSAASAETGYLWFTDECGVRDQHPCYFTPNAGTHLVIVPDLDLIAVATGYYEDFINMPVNLFLLSAVESNSALSPNPTAQDTLLARVDALANPAPVPVTVPPDQQIQTSGKTFEFENELGWTSLTLTFGDDEALLELDVQGEHMTFPVGLDGMYRISRIGLPADPQNRRPVANVPLALKGEWEENVFVITARDLLGSLHGEFRLNFRDGLRLSISGQTGLPTITTVIEDTAE